MMESDPTTPPNSPSAEKPTSETLRHGSKSVIDELEYIDDENERFWKTPSSARMVRGGTVMLVVDIIGSIFFSIYMMQLGRASTEDASMLAVIDTFSIMLRFFAYLGFTGAGSKFLAEYLARDKNTARIYAVSAVKYNTIFTGIPLTVIALWLLFTQAHTEIQYVAYLSLLIICVCDRLMSNANIYLIGYQRYDLFTWAYYVPSGLQYVAAMIAYPLFGVKGPLICFAVAHIVMMILSFALVKKCSDFPLSDLFHWGKEYGLFWKMVSFNFLYSLANLAFALLTSTLLISGGNLLGVLTTQEIVALYTISTFSNILMNLFNVVAPIMQAVAEAHAMKNKKLVENYVMIAVKFPLVMTVAVLTFFLLFGPEMIEIFYGPRWITMGMLIMVCLMPAYCTGSFASRYDNILAGIGRPETVIVPWMVALALGIGGLLLSTFLPAGAYLVSDLIEYKGVTLDYGISTRFALALVMTSIGLFLGGIWIVRICIRVLGVRLPGHYFWKPILTAGITAVIVKIFLFFVPLRVILNGWLEVLLGGVVFTVIMVLGGVILFLTIGLLCDVMNIQDGKFWKRIIEGMGPIAKLIAPLLTYCRWLLKHQFRKLVHPPVVWVLATDKKTLQSDSQFRVKVKPLSKGLTASEHGVEVIPGQELAFQLDVVELKVPLFNLTAYCRIDFTARKESLQYLAKIEAGESSSLKIQFTVPTKILAGSHEVLINFEAYETPNDALTPKMYLKKGWWSFWDYRMRWFHEEQYFIYVNSR